MSGEIIRLGDPTSHGGKVLEGSLVDICHGKPIAYLGHKTTCPKCKGIFPIIEGALTTSFYGNGVALAGMKTACGASLIPTQFTDTVEYGGQPAALPMGLANFPFRNSERGTVPQPAVASAGIFDLFFLVKSASGVPLPHTPYKITLEDGHAFFGDTDAAGRTQKVESDTAQTATIEVPYYEQCDTDPDSESDTCSC